MMSFQGEYHLVQGLRSKQASPHASWQLSDIPGKVIIHLPRFNLVTTKRFLCFGNLLQQTPRGMLASPSLDSRHAKLDTREDPLQTS